jgi:TRAP transporter TAXI family solute receptor
MINGLALAHRCAGVASLIGVAFAATPASTQTIDLGTDSIGSLVNITGSTLAKVISQNSDLNVRARAFAGPEAWMPEMNNGKIALGAHFTASFYIVYNHFETKLHLPNLRVIRSSRGRSPLGFLVKADSDIKSVADLKGRKVAGGYGGQPVIRVIANATMRAYGISYDDVSIVPAVNVVQGVNAVVDGRADAAWASPSMPQVRQAHAKVKVRFLPLAGVSASQEDEIRKHSFPSIYIDKFGADRTPWLPADTPMLTQEMYLGASTKTSDLVVAKVLDALWKAEAALLNAHPAMSGFLNSAAVTLRPVVPYHPAAIAFYKHQGVWSDDADKASAALLKN